MWFGLSIAAWEAIGTWIASIGTVGAVGAAIWIARRDNAVRLRVFATVGQIAGQPAIPLERKHVWITATNIGRRTVTVTTVGWRSGLLRYDSPWLARQYAMQQVGPLIGPQLPLKMQDGDSASWMIPLDEWLDGVEKLIASPRWLGLRTMYVQAFSSTGDVVSVRVSSSLREKIARAIASKGSSYAQP
jgi:hypothetical protein